ncbi:histidine kinase [Enterobacterales bacterium CwR94]|nr:histidine kinase [Enterobacterales bacterium CwR94]
MRIWFTVSLLLATFSSSAESINVGLIDDRPPYVEFNFLKHPTGALPELLGLLPASGQPSLALQPASDLAHLEQMLMNGQVMMALAPPLAPRPAGVLISKPLFHQQWALISRINHVPLSARSVNLDQQRILILPNSPVEPRLKQLWPNVVIENSHSLKTALKMLNNGAADGLVCDADLADMLSHNLYPGLLISQNLPTIKAEQVFWLPPGQQLLLNQINQRIDALSPGAASAIITRWRLNAALDNLQPGSEPRSEYFELFIVVSSVTSLFLIAFLMSEILRRRKAERGLLDALAYWQNLINSVPTPLLVCNPAGTITHCNQSLLSLLKLSSARIVGKSLNSFWQNNPMAPTLEHQEWLNVISTQEPQFSDRTITVHNENIEVMLWLGVYSDSRNIPQGLLVGWFDISERKRLERELAISSQQAIDANSAKSEFLARMSHEIRSPMNAILGLLELEHQKKNSASSPLNIAYAASRQLLDVVGGVLDLSKIEAGEIRLQPKNTALHPLITQIVHTYTSAAERKGLRLTSDIEAISNYHYLVDGPKLGQILNNLINNSIKYTERGWVCLRVIRNSSHNGIDNLTFEVQDSGMGIAQEMQEKILQPYIQVNPDSRDSSGLGLAICLQFLKMMDSRLSIQSTPGRGSTFSFTLSLAELKEAPIGQVICVEETPTHPLQLLVVDDQPANLVVMSLQLESLGHHVTTCGGGKRAEQLLKQQRFDVVFTDCQMPIMSGYQLAKRQRQREAKSGGYQVIVGCTANAFNNEEKRCLESGMDGVLIKPLALNDLRQLLHTHQQIRLDMREIKALAVNQPHIITSIIQELLSSSAQERQRLLNIPTDNAEQFAAILHRQKGSFALAGFQAGIDLCQTIENGVQDGNTSSLPLLRLQLNALILRFIVLLSNYK